MKKKQAKEIAINILKVIPMIAFVGFALFTLSKRDKLTVEAIVSFVPENPVIAAVIVLILYAVKSVSVFFPLIVLKMAVGVMYPPLIAILINTAGIIVSFMIPYAMGRRSKKGFYKRLSEKNPKIASLINPNKDRQFFICVMLRAMYFLPSDIVSMFLGSMKIPMLKYVIGGLIGMMPSIITTTLMGSSIDKVSSPMFLISTVTMIVTSVGSIWIQKLLTKRKNKE